MMMMDLKETCVDPQTTQDEEVHSGSRLRKLLLMEMEDGHISPSKVAQKHICAPSNNRYSVSNAFELFNKATGYGFGNIIDVTTPSKWRVKKFRKTPYDCLSPRPIEILCKLKITNEEYQETCRTTSSITATLSLLNNESDHLPPSDLWLSKTWQYFTILTDDCGGGVWTKHYAIHVCYKLLSLPLYYLFHYS